MGASAPNAPLIPLSMSYNTYVLYHNEQPRFTSLAVSFFCVLVAQLHPIHLLSHDTFELIVEFLQRMYNLI